MLIRILQSNWKIIAVLAVFGFAVSFGLALAQAPLYTAESRVLVRYIQTAGVDAFVASRAASKIGQTLSQVVHTELFLQKTLKTPYMQDVELPPVTDPVARRIFWEQTVRVAVRIDSSILTVKANTSKADDAKNIVQAVTYVFMTQGEEFHGAAGLVSLTQVDAPAITKSSARPHVIARSAFGLLLGLLLGCTIGFVRVALGSGMQTTQLVEIVSTLAPAKQVASVEDVRQSPQELWREERARLDQEIVQKNEQALLSVSGEFPSQPRVDIHTIFDDFVRLGLDPARLSVEA